MATELAKAYVQVVPSAEGMSSGISNIMNGSDVTSATNKAGSSIGGTLVKGIGTALAAGAATVAAAATAMWSGINATAQVGDNIDKTSQKLQVTTDQYQAMAYAAEHCGFSTSVLNTAQKTLANTDFGGNIYEAIGYIQTLGTEEERTAAAAELFGSKAAQQMQPLINGSMSIDEYSQSLSELGGMMSSEAVAASAAFEDAMTDLQTAISGAKNGLMAEFLPGVTEVINGLTGLFSGSGSASTQISKGLEDITKKFTDAMPKVMKTFTDLAPSLLKAGAEILKSLAQGIIDNLPNLMPAVINIVTTLVQDLISMLPELLKMGMEIILELILGIAEALPDMIPAIVDVMLTIVDTLIDNIDLLIDASIAIIIGLAEGLINALPKLIEKLPDIIIKLVNALIDNAPKIAKAGLELMVLLAKALIDNVPKLLAMVPEIATKLIDTFIDKFKKIKEVGKNIVKGLWEGIKDVKDWLLDKISGFVDSVVGGIKDFFGIHSPSKLMADEVGKFLPEGMAVGIEANADSVYSAMDDIGNNMLSMSNKSVVSNSTQSMEEMMYQAFSRALNDHQISFNDRELGRLVRSYA